MTPKFNIALLQLAKDSFQLTSGPAPIFSALTLIVDLNALNEPLVEQIEKACAVHRAEGEAAATIELEKVRPFINAAFDRMINQIKLCQRVETAVKALV